MIKPISTTEGFPIMAVPLVTVIAISMVKDIFEDYKRHKSDKRENETNATRMVAASGKEVGFMWKDVRVGTVLKVLRD